MKRLISLLLCLVLACGMLVSCDQEVIGGHADELKQQFYVPPEERISLKLYVVYDEADAGALTEVERRINSWCEVEYNTKIDVVYLKATEYDAEIAKAVEANEKAIVLITDKSVMDTYYDESEIVVTETYDLKQATDAAPVVKVVTKYVNGSVSEVKKYDKTGKVVTGTAADDAKIPVGRQVSVGKFEDLSEYVLKTDAKYGLLNAKIASSLMDTAKLDYTLAGNESEGLFAIPNNRLIGGVEGYEYVKINRQVCEIWLNHTKAELMEIDTDAEIEALRGEIVSELGYTAQQAEECVEIIYGNYATKDALEAEEKLILNIKSAPVVEEGAAFEGAFAVLKGTDVERAMRIIYAINMDETLHNLLQYGIKDTNYKLVYEELSEGVYSEDALVEAITAEGKNYKMNPLYTGNLFSVYFSEEHNWTPEVKQYAEAQNLAADRLYEALRAPAAD